MQEVEERGGRQEYSKGDGRVEEGSERVERRVLGSEGGKGKKRRHDAEFILLDV